MKRLTPLTALLVFLIALAGFALSYSALYEYAQANGVNHTLAWLWPLVIDGFMIVISLSILRASLYQEPVRYLWLLAIIATGVSIAFNIAHAPATLAGRAVATVAPVAMFAAFEVFIGQIRRNSERKQVQANLKALQENVLTWQANLNVLQAQVTKAQETLKVTKEENKTVKAEVAKAQTELKATQARLSEAQDNDPRAKVIAYYAENPQASQGDAAQKVGVSRARVGQILKDLETNGLVHRNGNGVEVKAN